MRRLCFMLISVALFLSYGCSHKKTYNEVVKDPVTGIDILRGYANADGLKVSFFREYYLKGLETYQGDSQVLTDLSVKLKDVKFVLVMGTWDDQSKYQVPRFMAMLFSVKGYDPTVSQNVEIICIDSKYQAGSIKLEDIKNDSLPVVKIYKKGEQIGEIKGIPSEPIELAVANILNIKR